MKQFIAILFIAFSLYSCDDHPNPEVLPPETPGPPSIQINVAKGVWNITDSSATANAGAIWQYGAAVTVKGLIWWKNNDTVFFRTNEGGGTDAFNSTMTNLTPETMYHVRAYAINSYGEGRSHDTLNFTTLK